MTISVEKNRLFYIFAQNIDYGYTLELPERGGSNEYPQSMFWIKIKKNLGLDQPIIASGAIEM